MFEALKQKLFGSAPARPTVRLSAFGKHPGWNDHIDDLGVESEALMAAKQFLYVQGIGGVIDSGLWEKPADGDESPPFQHAFLWGMDEQQLVGRLWASSDGKNRTRYPMILCAQLEQAPSDAAVTSLFAQLAKWEEVCRGTTSAEVVRGLVQQGTFSAQAELDRLPPFSQPSRSDFARKLGLAGQSEAWARLLYALRSDFAQYLPESFPKREGELSLRLAQSKLIPQALRVPADASDAVGSLLFWRAAMRGILDRGAPLLFSAPVGKPWLDIVAGPLTTKHLYCLRASMVALPLITEVPFNVPEETRAEARRVAAALGFA
jgi:hypothetical protein